MIKVIAILVALYSIAALRAAVGHGDATWAILGVFAGVTALGLWLKKSWSQYLFYAFGSSLVALWVLSSARALEGKWAHLDSPHVVIVTLLPGFAMVFVLLGLSLLVRRGFRSAPQQRELGGSYIIPFSFGLVALIASALSSMMAISLMSGSPAPPSGLYHLALAVMPLLLGGFVVARTNGRLWVAFVLGVFGAWLGLLLFTSSMSGEGAWLFEAAFFVLAGCVCMGGFGVGRLGGRRRA